MSPDQFKEITPREFFGALKDEKDRREYKTRIIADSIRMQTLKLLNIQLPRHKKIRSEKLLWHLPWDFDAGKVKYQTAGQMKNVLKAMARDTKGNKKRGARGITTAPHRGLK